MKDMLSSNDEHNKTKKSKVNIIYFTFFSWIDINISMNTSRIVKSKPLQMHIK